MEGTWEGPARVQFSRHAVVSCFAIRCLLARTNNVVRFRKIIRVGLICSLGILNYDSQVTHRLKLAAACLLLVLGAFFLPSSAQRATDVASLPLYPAPYRVGEHLTYNVSFSNFVSVAHIELLVAARGTFFGREGIQLKGHVETVELVNAALFSINNDYITYVDPATGLPYHGQQMVREASRTAETAADFNQPAGTAAIPPKRIGEFPGTYDFLSTIYRVRALPLKDGSTYYLNVRNENENYQLEIKVKGREVIKTNVGSFDTIVSVVWLKSNARANSYGMKAYFSDDERHVPVLVTARHPAGEIRTELAGSEFIATPAVPPPPGPTPTPSAPPRQSPIAIPTQPPTEATEENTLEDLPFKVGEQLNYQVFLANIPAPVARVSFQVRSHSKFFDHDGLWFTVSAQTTNALQHLFVANDVINSYVDPKALLPFHTEFNLSEGRRRFSSKLTINQDYGSAITDTGERIEIPVGTHDYLSFFYALRTFSLSPPKRSAISILVNNKPKTLFITALNREAVQLGSETIPAIQVSLTTDDAQSDKFQLRAWISDDKRRLPLRLIATTELGPLRADLAIIPVSRQ
jgi:Protein of unknown function (DUF3108)